MDALLKDAAAYGRTPTPIDDIVESARLVVERNVSLDEGFLARLYKKVGGGLGKVVAGVKQAIQKVLGLFDSRTGRIYLDQTVIRSRRRFLTLHETGHGSMKWHREAYSIVEDCKSTIAPEVQDLFDREANFFASDALFQCERFENEARDLPFDRGTPLKLASRYGSSPYAAFRRYVTTNHRACGLLILEKPEVLKDIGRIAKFRRFLASPQFEHEFGELEFPKFYSAVDPVGQLLPYGKQKFTGPCELQFPDRRGDERPLIAQGFFTSYFLLILIIPQSALTKSTVVV